MIKHNNLKFKTLLTIHNLNHQGKYSIDVIKRTGMDHSKCRVIQWETKKKQINFLLEGIIHADLVNAVSPTYAKEIFTEEYGSGLDEIIRNEGQKISGILNGIDYDSRDPMKDKNINFHYGLKSTDVNFSYKIHSPIEGKKLNKAFLQEKLGFTVSDEIPLIGFIGRFESKQKGLDIMHKMIRRVNLQKFQFVILGQGEVEWEDQFLWLASFYKKNVSYISVFDKRIASQIYAGADFLLVPSKFEPCGLIQMIAMRYGTLPIARATGGLKDSIIDGVDGFLFKKYSSFDLEKKMKKAVEIWKHDKNKINEMIVNAMKKDFTWDKSAKEYIKLYNSLYGIKYTILVYSNVYGERQNSLGEAGVISIFINNLIIKKQPEIFGELTKTARARSRVPATPPATALIFFPRESSLADAQKISMPSSKSFGVGIIFGSPKVLPSKDDVKRIFVPPISKRIYAPCI